MQSLIKTFTLSLMFAGLTACGGGGGGGGKKPAPTEASSTPVSSAPATSSSSAMVSSSSSLASSSSAPATSSAESSSSAASAAAGSEATLAATSYTNYSVAEIENCGVNISAATKTFAVFADYDGGVQNQSLSSLNFSGWNHATNGSTTEWTKLKHPGATYNFSTNAKVNDSCNGADTMNIVLLKKVADWDHQHSNGFERNVLSYGYKFGDIENLVLDVKINSAKTTIPSVDSLKTTYASYVTGATVDAMDSGKVNIGITLHDGGNLNAAIIVELDQNTLKDKWVRVTIPMKNLKFYSEVNYVRTDKTLADLSNVVIKRGLFVAETRTGSVLRGNINSWSTSVPETFKEMDLSFKKIEFQLK